MIIVDKNKATMAGPDELIECEAMIFVEAVKRHFIKNASFYILGKLS